MVIRHDICFTMISILYYLMCRNVIETSFSGYVERDTNVISADKSLILERLLIVNRRRNESIL